MTRGNDDLLFGQPADLEEAAGTIIAFYGEDRLRIILKRCFSGYENKQVFGIAEFIRNNWFLWWHPNHDSDQFPASKPPLLAFFHDAGITHPDDMTDILFSFILHHFNNIPFDFAGMVDCLQAYWKEQGYPDGKPDINSL